MLPSLSFDARNRGFTFTELLVAFVIIAFLCLISLSVVSSMRSSSVAVKCLGNLRSYGTALLVYTADHQGLPWWNGKSFPASADPPSTRPNFEAWVRPYLHKQYQNRLRCPLKPSASSDYTFEYAGNASLCWYFPKLNNIPAPSSKVVLAMEFGDFNFYWTAPMNAVMWGVANGEFSGAPIHSDSRKAQYHGTSKRRGLHMFFLDGHAALIQPDKGNWSATSRTSTYANGQNDGILYDYHQFRNLYEGSLTIY